MTRYCFAHKQKCPRKESDEKYKSMITLRLLDTSSRLRLEIDNELTL